MSTPSKDVFISMCLYSKICNSVQMRNLVEISCQVIGHKGLLADRTRILVTHNVSYLPYADRVIVLKDGMVAEQGTYNELVRESQVFAELVNQLKAQQDKVSISEDPNSAVSLPSPSRRFLIGHILLK